VKPYLLPATFPYLAHFRSEMFHECSTREFEFPTSGCLPRRNSEDRLASQNYPRSVSRNPEVLTIISWNTNHRNTSWEALSHFDADIALLQEVTKAGVPEASEIQVVPPPTANWRIQHYGSSATAVAVLNPELEFRPVPSVGFGLGSPNSVVSTHLGQFSVVRGQLGNKKTYFVSLYGIIENDYADGSVHRAISDLTPLIEQGAEVLIGADLNAFRGYSISGKQIAVERHKNLFDRLEVLGLTCVGPFSTTGPLSNCPCNNPASCDHVQTHRHMNKETSRAFQNDYIFATAELKSRLISCRALTDQSPELWELSDHAPIEARISLR